MSCGCRFGPVLVDSGRSRLRSGMENPTAIVPRVLWTGWTCRMVPTSLLRGTSVKHNSKTKTQFYGGRDFSPLIPLHKRWTSRSETRRLATASAPGAPDPDDTLVARSGWMFYPTTCAVYKPCNIRWTLSDVYDTLFSNISSRTILSNHRHTCPARRSWEAPGGVHPFTIPHSLKRGCLPRPV